MPQSLLGAPVEPCEPLSIPARTVHRGRYVVLEPISPQRHANGLFHASHHCAEAEAVWTYLPDSGPFSDTAEMETWLERCRQHPQFIFFAVRYVETDRLIGMVSYTNIEPEMHRLEVGFIWYAPEFQQTSVNTESVFLLLSEAFEHLGYRRVEWKCDALNQRSRMAALRLGFSFEGVFRKHMIVNGRNRDTAWFSMTDDDWPQVRSNYLRWLYENDGVLSLSELNRSILFASLLVV